MLVFLNSACKKENRVAIYLMEESTKRVLLILEFRFFSSSRLRAKKRNVGERRMFTPVTVMFSFG